MADRLPISLLLGGLLLATSAGAAEPPHSRWQARYSDAPSATEYWDLSARMDSGHHLFARFFITNEGPGIHTAAGIGTLIQPDGAIVPFRWGRRKGDWTLSADGLLIDIASLVLDMRGQPRRFELDSDKRGIKIHLSFESRGRSVSGDNTPVPHHFDVLEMAAPIEGSIWVKGMPEAVRTHGVVTLTHAWMDTAESDLVQRQVEVVFTHSDMAVYATDFRGPNGTAWGWLAVRERGEIVAHASVRERGFGEALGGPSRYPLPRTVRLDAEGALLTMTVARELLRLNPIEVVPQPFRFVLSLKMNPQKISATGDCALKLGSREIRGGCSTAVTYLNPF
ncbi:MAG TPA: hypothetical protein VEB21_03285 [Terriglobales bacterium]|nr:hypothetical protein [Terriglobales bacterium]